MAINPATNSTLTALGSYLMYGSEPVPSMTLKQFVGRKFRDTEEPCESPDTNTKTTSNE